MSEYMLLIVSAIFVENILLIQFLGNCPFLGTSQKMSTATGMSMAVVFVMTFAGAITWVVYRYLLIPFELEYAFGVCFAKEIKLDKCVTNEMTSSHCLKRNAMKDCLPHLRCELDNYLTFIFPR